MPKYVVFVVTSDRVEAATRDGDDDGKTKDDPLVQKMLSQFIAWIAKETESGRVEGGQAFVDASDEASIRVNFHDPDVAPADLEMDD